MVNYGQKRSITVKKTVNYSKKRSITVKNGQLRSKTVTYGQKWSKQCSDGAIGPTKYSLYSPLDLPTAKHPTQCGPDLIKANSFAQSEFFN